MSTDPSGLGNYLQVANQYYVLANSVLADHETRVLKQGETFAVFDPYGDVIPVTHPEAGVFHKGTRYLSRFEIYIAENQRPLLLNSTLRDDNGVLKVEMTNSDMQLAGAGFLQKGSLHIQREKFLLCEQCHERVTIENFSHRDVALDVLVMIDADFSDIFEVRGSKRKARGEGAPPQLISANGIKLQYTGLDQVQRSTSIRIHGVADSIACDLKGKFFRVRLRIRSRASLDFLVEIGFDEANEIEQKVAGRKIERLALIDSSKDDSDAPANHANNHANNDANNLPNNDANNDATKNLADIVARDDIGSVEHFLDDRDFAMGLARVKLDHDTGRGRFCSVKTSNEQFESWLRRSTDDLVMMTTETPEGHLYPYAGIPWFCAAFGRDGIVTALECLWANPELAKGVLQLLADTQAKEVSPSQDATPGKIIHELRFGEMANLKEIPFGRYYGSVDSTPLFVCLAGAYFERTADLELVRQIWPNLLLALEWIEKYGDRDGDGFIEYRRENADGLVQQGWKDSHDSIFHENGDDALGPIALSEVQGYCYMAYDHAAKMALALKRSDLSVGFQLRAQSLRENFDRAFWLEDLGTYALALDGNKRPCRVASSNAGQCLFTGIVKPERVQTLVKTLMRPESFSGWGIRTVATTAARYNPMSYHNGSVWPHDSALVALGMAKMGFTSEAMRIFDGLFRSANYMALHRMPEVYCGFAKREGESPTLYPNACSPQSWAAGAVYMVLQALLGLRIDAAAQHVHFRKPRLPESLETVKLLGLQVGTATLDVVVQNYHSDVSVQILKRSGEISVTVEK